MSRTDALFDSVSWPFLMPRSPNAIGLAVSGGGDSMAMLHLLGPGLVRAGKAVAVATVDHGLRPEAAAEAAFVARTCAGLGIPHDTLRWSGWDGRGNLSAAAREARYRLLADWARGRGIGAVALAHTMDDQAETVLMRLARGSGVDGLSAMRARRKRFGMRWERPFLTTRRADLRDWLAAQGHAWIDDPSNEDMARERVRIRQALPLLAELGITAEAISDTAFRMGQARDALERAVRDNGGVAVPVAGAVVLDRCACMALPTEIGLRLMARALRWVSPAGDVPRYRALWAAYARVTMRQTTTLSGAILSGSRDHIVIARELRPVAGLETPTDAVWDNRWRLEGPHDPGLTIRALGDAGLRLCPGWRSVGLPRKALLATPAVWRGADLIAAPLAGKPAGWTAQTVADFGDFLKSD